MSDAPFNADGLDRLVNEVSTMNCDEKPAELEVSDGMLSVTELAKRIPNKSVVAKLLEPKERITPSMPQWDGYYKQPDNPYPNPPCFTFGDWQTAVESIQLFIESEWAWHVVAGAGGLLLWRGESLEERRRLEAQREAQRKAADQRLPGRREKSTRRQKSKAPPGNCPCCLTWAPLVVCNPVTKQVRILPEAKTCEAGKYGEPWDYVGVQAALIERPGLNYDVILALKSSVFVYRSTTHKWRRYQCQRPTIFAILPRSRPWDRNAPWTCVGGRLYCMDVVRNGPGKHVVSLFEVDYEAETWKRRGHFTVGKRRWNVLRLDPAFQSMNCVDIMESWLSLELLECMGKLYVVIAAGVHEHLTTDYTSAFTVEEYLQCPDIPGLDTYPIQFHILNLKDGFNDDRENSDDDGRDSFRHRILRMVLPQSPKLPPYISPDNVEGFDVRKQQVLSLYERPVIERGRMGRWFCIAKESKIFVHLYDCMLQFDVVTGESKTGVICEHKMFGIRDSVYFPNANMMP